MARGKKVLFVAEKRAAIDAVLDRLHRRGLSDLVLDLHAGTSSRKQIAEDLARSLQLTSTIPSVDRTSELKRLEARRAELLDHDEAMHEPRDPWGVNVYGAQAQLLGVDATARTELRLSKELLARLGEEAFAQASEHLRGYAALGGLTLRRGDSAWAGAHVTTETEARRALELARNIRQHALPLASRTLKQASIETGVNDPGELAGWRPRLDLWADVADTLEHFEAGLYTADLHALATALAPAKTGGLSRAAASLTNGRYRAARNEIRALARTERPGPAEMLAGVETASDQLNRWRSLAADGSVPSSPANLADAESRP